MIIREEGSADGGVCPKSIELAVRVVAGPKGHIIGRRAGRSIIDRGAARIEGQDGIGGGPGRMIATEIEGGNILNTTGIVEATTETIDKRQQSPGKCWDGSTTITKRKIKRCLRRPA